MKRSNYYKPGPVTLVPGVTHKRADTRRDIYRGEAEALVRAGLLRADMLPAPGHCSISWRPEGQQRPGRAACFEPGYMTILPHPAGGYRVYLAVSREEQARRAAEAERKDQEAAKRCQELKRQRDAADGRNVPTDAEKARRELACMCASHTAFREWYAAWVFRSVKNEIKLMNEHLCCDGYTMAQETLDEFMDEIADAVAVLRDGASVLNAKTRAVRVAELRARIARGDGDFKPFMAKLLEPLAENNGDEGSDQTSQEPQPANPSCNPTERRGPHDKG